jgi:hypothetical protein
MLFVEDDAGNWWTAKMAQISLLIKLN